LIFSVVNGELIRQGGLFRRGGAANSNKQLQKVQFFGEMPFTWRKGSKDSRGQGFKCLLSNDFIIVASILSTAVILERMSAIALLICNV
jgi:hypothetical protein